MREARPVEPAADRVVTPDRGLRLAAASLAVVLALLALPTVVLTVFALSPTQCPDVGGSPLCRWPVTALIAMLCVAGLLLAAFALAGAATRARSQTRIGLSLACEVAALALVVGGAASWSG